MLFYQKNENTQPHLLNRLVTFFVFGSSPLRMCGIEPERTWAKDKVGRL